MPRAPLPHPDADRPTRRMTFEELRSLGVEVTEAECAEVEDDSVDAFDTQLTPCLPSKPRASTLDDLIDWLRTAPPLAVEVRPKTRRRA
jgi:hypothetical protein